MFESNEITIDISSRTGVQKPRRTEIVRKDNKSETQDRDLDYIQNTCSILRDIRLTLHYTQPDIAQKSGLRQQMISRIDRNDLNPRLSTIKRYLSACGINLDELLQNALNDIQNAK